MRPLYCSIQLVLTKINVCQLDDKTTAFLYTTDTGSLFLSNTKSGAPLLFRVPVYFFGELSRGKQGALPSKKGFALQSFLFWHFWNFRRWRNQPNYPEAVTIEISWQNFRFSGLIAFCQTDPCVFSYSTFSQFLTERAKKMDPRACQPRFVEHLIVRVKAHIRWI